MKCTPWILLPVTLLAMVGCSERKLGEPTPFPVEELVSGGVPKDGIPALTSPPKVSASSASFLATSSLVAGVAHNGDAVAYPIMVMDKHEVANDRVGDRFTVISYCPLTGTAVGFTGGRRGEAVEFGVSGLLFRNNLMMYDRSDDEQLWSQMWGSGVTSAWAGTQLPRTPVLLMTWSLWRTLNPGTRVVDPAQINLGRTYGDGITYPGYDTSPETLFTVKHKDDRLPPKQLVVGLIVSGTARAYSIDALGTRVLADTLAGVPVLGVFLSGADYGVVFSPVVGADSLQFALLNAADATAFMRDANTGSVWDAMGRAQSGSLAGTRLAVLSAYTAYWFAWADFYPGSEIYSP